MRKGLWLVMTLGLALLLLGLLQTGLANAQAGDTPNHADVVVDLGDGRVIARRITFSEADISGLQALKLTGLDLSIADFDFGAAVCSVEQVGCPVDNCFCDSDLFWGYQHLEEGSWQAYQVGAADSAVAGGAVEGWLWGPFDAALPQVTQEYLAA
ncbi:MAG: hypothetical protein ACK2U9_21475, partial [Anaerolineae bacterium]